MKNIKLTITIQYQKTNGLIYRWTCDRVMCVKYGGWMEQRYLKTINEIANEIFENKILTLEKMNVKFLAVAIETDRAVVIFKEKCMQYFCYRKLRDAIENVLRA